MKKVLFATTALVATAGVAAADIAITGTAEIGIVAGDRYGLLADESGIAANNAGVRLHNSYTLNFAMSGATDNGLSFGATTRFDMDATNEENQGIGHDNGTAFISGSFGRITLGDTDGALDWALTEVGIGGAIADDNTAHAGYNGNGGLDGSHDDQVLRYEYSVGDIGVAVSFEQARNGQSNAVARDDNIAFGVRYAAGGISLGLGYQTGDLYLDQGNDVGDVQPATAAGAASTVTATTLASGYTDMGRTNGEYIGANAIGLSAGYAANGLEFRASMMRVDLDAAFRDGTAMPVTELSHTGLGVGYTMDALTLAANWGAYNVSGDPSSDSSGFGVAANYDLGGGAVVQFGYGASQRDGGTADTESWSLGMVMSF